MKDAFGNDFGEGDAVYFQYSCTCRWGNPVFKVGVVERITEEKVRVRYGDSDLLVEPGQLFRIDNQVPEELIRSLREKADEANERRRAKIGVVHRFLVFAYRRGEDRGIGWYAVAGQNRDLMAIAGRKLDRLVADGCAVRFLKRGKDGVMSFHEHSNELPHKYECMLTMDGGGDGYWTRDCSSNTLEEIRLNRVLDEGNAMDRLIIDEMSMKWDEEQRERNRGWGYRPHREPGEVGHCRRDLVVELTPVPGDTKSHDYEGSGTFRIGGSRYSSVFEDFENESRMGRGIGTSFVDNALNGIKIMDRDGNRALMHGGVWSDQFYDLVSKTVREM